MTDATLLDELRRRFLPERLAANPTAVKDAMPGIRASLLLSARYAPDLGQRVCCPIFAFAGAEDPVVSAADMDHWRERTNAAFSSATLPGGHLFLLEEPRPMVEAYGGVLRHV